MSALTSRLSAALGSRTCRAQGALAVALVILTAVAALATPAAARVGVADIRGTIGVGYAKLSSDVSPAGSMSASVGVSVPVTPRFSVGPAIAFHLLGSQTVERGSLLASVDYSAFELGVLGHWKPEGWGPIALISAGPELVTARAELSTTGGGAAFSDLAIQETAGAAAVNVTLMKSRESPVRVGLELGARWAFMKQDDWKLLSTRLCFHF